VLDKTKTFLADLWALTKPFWWSEERWAARGLLAAIVALNLGLVYVNVLINQWNNDFYNTLQQMDKDGFFHQLLRFSGLAAAYIVVAVYQLYLNQMLQIRWRRWLTGRYLADWIGARVYYRLQLTDSGTDNPDQRIADDLAGFCDRTLNLSLGFLTSLVTLVSFVSILWALSGTMSFALDGAQIHIPGYMVWVALVYALAGTLFIHFIGRPLIGLNFNQQKFEANFRFSLVRFRENAEAIALYAGEATETRRLMHGFGDVVANWWAIMRRQKTLVWFRAGYNQTALIFPFLVAAPRFFSGAIKLGGLMQTASAFGQVQDALSWFVNAYTQIAEWKATVDRLTGFRAACHRAQQDAQSGAGVALGSAEGAELVAQAVRIDLPQGQPLLAPLDLVLKPGESVLVTGPSGAGKSTLFRALAGIWPFGQGTVGMPRRARVLFLPQKPYLTIGSLREQLCYPAGIGTASDGELRGVLKECSLDHLIERLDEEEHWAQQLSGGEQQRVAFARALMQKPDWLFMDEATSALDEASEAQLYRLLRSKLPRSTVISIGHRSSLAQFHQRRLLIRSDQSQVRRLLWDVDPAVPTPHSIENFARAGL
jgi:vitamin B12/bleomycin/antimicrobial peptide transport system ATP-binding/permease protein